MGKEIVVDINPYQTRVVLIENGKPSEVYIERRGRERLVGNIYKGRVQNVIPGMQAAFVDIGLERNAFLYSGDIQIDSSDFTFNGEKDEEKLSPPNIKDIVKPGQEIMVQIVKEPIGTKGARVTTNVTLPGRTLVLMPTMDYVGVSRRLDNEGERMRLKEVLESIKPEGMGLIVRTVAEGKSKEEFENDLNFLLRVWNRIKQKNTLSSAPRMIHAEEPLIFRVIRDLFTPDVERLSINDKDFFDRVQIVAGILSSSLSDRVVYNADIPDLFDRLGIEQAIDAALNRKVRLSNGGYIIIDQTEAFTCIDVNTGKYVGSNDKLQETITEMNCEAAKEIARQLRLRDISGIIVVDFIDMDEIADKERVLSTLKEELTKDRTKSNVLGITQLGLVEMTRKKTRHTISHTLETACPYCGGSGKVLSAETVLLKVRRQLMCRFAEEDIRNYIVRVHPDVASLIDENSTPQSPVMPQKDGCTVYVQSVPDQHIAHYEIMPLPSQEEIDFARKNAKAYGG